VVFVEEKLQLLPHFVQATKRQLRFIAIHSLDTCTIQGRQYNSAQTKVGHVRNAGELDEVRLPSFNIDTQDLCEMPGESDDRCFVGWKWNRGEIEAQPIASAGGRDFSFFDIIEEEVPALKDEAVVPTLAREVEKASTMVSAKEAYQSPSKAAPVSRPPQSTAIHQIPQAIGTCYTPVPTEFEYYQKPTALGPYRDLDYVTNPLWDTDDIWSIKSDECIRILQLVVPKKKWDTLAVPLVGANINHYLDALYSSTDSTALKDIAAIIRTIHSYSIPNPEDFKSAMTELRILYNRHTCGRMLSGP
jgi:hypothetical protein